MGVELTSPCAWVEHLADLLRNRVNSQWYPSIDEDWRSKLYRTLKNQRVRRVLQDNKVPETSAGTRATADPGPAPIGSWERARSRLPPMPNKI